MGGLYIVKSIIYKIKYEKTENLLQKDKKIYLYITKYIHNLVKKEILLIRKFQSFQLESFWLSSYKIFYSIFVT